MALRVSVVIPAFDVEPWIGQTLRSVVEQERQPDEILVFKLFDSDRGRVQWTGHTAFNDPGAAPDAPPRESIEIRTISFLPA